MGGLHSPSSLAIRPAPVHFMLSKSLSIIKLAGAASMGIFRAGDRKSTRLNSSHTDSSRMPSSA